MAQKGFDKLMEMTDSRYRLSIIAARRAAQLKNGIPTTLVDDEYPPTRNTVTIALTELVLDKKLKWGTDMPTNAELKRTVDADRRADPASYAQPARTPNPDAYDADRDG